MFVRLRLWEGDPDRPKPAGEVVCPMFKTDPGVIIHGDHVFVLNEEKGKYFRAVCYFAAPAHQAKEMLGLAQQGLPPVNRPTEVIITDEQTDPSATVSKGEEHF